MKDEDWMKDTKTGKPLKWIIVKVKKIIEQEVPIAVYHDEDKAEAIEHMKNKDMKNFPFGDMGFFDSKIKVTWEYE